MTATEGLKDDLTAYIARMREQQYPELLEADVIEVLKSLTRCFQAGAWSDRARARDECEKQRRQHEPRRTAEPPEWLTAAAIDEGGFD